MDFFAVATSQRACRAFTAADVDDAVLAELLTAATHAPSAENRQPWVFVVVRDEQRRGALGELARNAWEAHGRSYSEGRLPPALLAEVDAGARGGIAGAPVLVVVCGDTDASHPAALPASIWPAVQNLLLAAGARGLGSALTTLGTMDGPTLRELLDLPDTLLPMAIVPIGHPAALAGPGPPPPPRGAGAPRAIRPAVVKPADALVLFGATGDLSKRKLLPALYQLERRGQLPENLVVVGLARTDWDDERFRKHAHEAAAAVTTVDDAVFARLSQRLQLVGGDYNDRAMFEVLAERLAPCRTPAFYLAIPPSAFEAVVGHLASTGAHHGGRVIVEKPFGRDLASARELNHVLHDAFPEPAIFRIDHYLGKESVENLLAFRFANSLLEPVWNRDRITSVQVTMAEEIAIEGRGAFYDSVGAIRDVVQNHLLQVVTLLAMEPPVDDSADALRDEKVKVLRTMPAVDPGSVVRGQFAGYLDEPGVAPDSTTETFAAMRFAIDSWRWAGVPFFVRAGKALGATALEAVIEMREPPRLLFAGADAHVPHPNLIRLRLGRDDGVTITLQAKAPGPAMRTRPVDLSVDFSAALGERQEAYERLLVDALSGDPRRFAREDNVEESWRVIDPVLTADTPVYAYAEGSWGPAEADAILAGGHWHNPGELHQ